jgi:DNA polymerase sigma
LIRQLSCDVNVNNTLALQNTKMIKTYVALDPRVRPLIMIVKYWTKQRLLNDAGKKILALFFFNMSLTN